MDMKVLMFIPALNAGGAERVMVTLANYLSRKGNQILIQTMNSDESFYQVDSNVKIKGMDYAFSKNMFLRILQIPFIEAKRARAFTASVFDFKPDVVLSFLFTTNVIALLSRKKIQVPLVISERSDPRVGGKIRRKLCACLYPKANLIICQGKAVAKYYTAFLGKCKVIANPLNTSAIGTYAEARKHRIVSVGRLIPEKNHMLLIEAFGEIHSSYPTWSLEIIGEGYLKEELNQAINNKGLEGHVFIRNNIKDVMREVSDSACFVLSSNYEGFPNVLLEAMASGLPVISTDFGTGIARELIADGKNGYVVPTGDVKKLAEALDKIISSEELQRKMGKANLCFKEDYSEEKICMQWEEALIEIMGKDND